VKEDIKMRDGYALPKRLLFWAQHLQQCSLHGLSLSAYAAEHGLSASSLYAARSTLRRRGQWPLPPTRFLRVATDAPASSVATASVAAPLYRIALSNGVVVETACGELSTVLAAAAALA
jgi:hypothetical protein